VQSKHECPIVYLEHNIAVHQRGYEWHSSITGCIEQSRQECGILNATIPMVCWMLDLTPASVQRSIEYLVMMILPPRLLYN
jgi:hypothetical protein